MFELVDTHCHLDFDSFENDRDEVIERAISVGITHIVNPGVNLISSQQSIHLSHNYPIIKASVGIHPNNALEWNDQTADILCDIAQDPKVIAIGEVGLDYYRDITPKVIQQNVFRRQLKIAADLNLPVLIHNRDASDDILSIVADWYRTLVEKQSPLIAYPGIFHSFMGDTSLVQSVIERNFLIGIGGPITFNNSKQLRYIIGNVPLESMVLETDSPFLTPHPFRGARNQPAYLQFIAEEISRLKNIPLNQVSLVTTLNANRIFKLVSNY